MFKKQKNQPTPGRNVGSKQQPNVFSYYNNRSRPEAATGRYDKPQLQRAPTPRRSVTGYIILFVVVSAVGWLGRVSPQTQIVSVTPADKTLLKGSDVYEQTARDIINGSLLYRSKLTFNSSGFADEFERRHPEAGAVAVKLSLFDNTPTIEVRPTMPAFILVAGNGAYVVDERGTAVLPVSEARSGLQEGLPRVQDETGLLVEAGKPILQRDNITFISYLQQQLSAKGHTVESMTLPAAANELHLRLQGRAYLIKLNLSENPTEQAGAILATLAKLESDDIMPAEYIDVRVAERVYLK